MFVLFRRTIKSLDFWVGEGSVVNTNFVDEDIWKETIKTSSNSK